MNTITVVELFDAAEKILDDLQTLIISSRPASFGANRIRAGLVFTIAEQFEAKLALIKINLSTHASAHLRSMIEALVAIKMLEDNIIYVDQMKYEERRGARRFYKGLIADENIDEVLKAPIRHSLEKCEADCDALKAAGLKPKKISDDFGAAGLPDLVAPYSMLCDFSHNGLAAILFRHDRDFNMVFRPDNSPIFVEAIIQTGLRVLMETTKKFGEIAIFPDGKFDVVFSSMQDKWTDVIEKRVSG